MFGSDEYPSQRTFAVREKKEYEDIAQPDIMIWILYCIIYSFINIAPCKLLPRWGLIQTRPDKFRCGIVDVSFTINRFWIFRTLTWGHICTILQAERILVPDFLVLCTLAQLAVCDTHRKSIYCTSLWKTHLQNKVECAGAILAIGRSGRETTLCTDQKYFLTKKYLFYVSKPNQWFKRCLCWCTKYST